MKKAAKKHNRNKKGIQRMGQSEEQLESQWDKMLKIKTTGVMTVMRMPFVIHMSQHHIVY